MWTFKTYMTTKEKVKKKLEVLILYIYIVDRYIIIECSIVALFGLFYKDNPHSITWIQFSSCCNN